MLKGMEDLYAARFGMSITMLFKSEKLNFHSNMISAR